MSSIDTSTDLGINPNCSTIHSSSSSFTPHNLLNKIPNETSYGEHQGLVSGERLDFNNRNNNNDNICTAKISEQIVDKGLSMIHKDVLLKKVEGDGSENGKVHDPPLSYKIIR